MNREISYHLNANQPNAQNGVEVLKKMKELSPHTEVIMLSGQDQIDVAVDSMKFGAYDCVVKGETAFARTENILNNISELHKVTTINNAYKRTIILLAVGIGIILLIALYMLIFTDAYKYS